MKSNKITNGSNNQPKRCREAQAVTAFLWFGFAAFAGSLFFSFLGMRSGLSPSTGGIRRGKQRNFSQSCGPKPPVNAEGHLRSGCDWRKMRSQADFICRTRQSLKALPSRTYASHKCLTSLAVQLHPTSHAAHVTPIHDPRSNLWSDNRWHLLGKLLDRVVHATGFLCLLMG